PKAAAFTSNVLVRPAVGTLVRIHGGFEIYPPHLTLRGVEISDGPVIVRQGSDYTRLEDLVVDGVASPQIAVELFANHTALVQSILTGNVDEDELHIGSGGSAVTDVLVQGNSIGLAVVGPQHGHVDCVQFASAASYVTVIDNILYRCANSSLIIKPDLGEIHHVVVANNFIQDCFQRTGACNGSYAVYVRTASYPIHDITFSHNAVNGHL